MTKILALGCGSGSHVVLIGGQGPREMSVLGWFWVPSWATPCTPGMLVVPPISTLFWFQSSKNRADKKKKTNEMVC